MSVVGIVRKASGTQDQIALEGAGDTNLHAKLIRGSGFTFGNHFCFGCVPAVELGCSFGLAVFGLGDNLNCSRTREAVRGHRLPENDAGNIKI